MWSKLQDESPPRSIQLGSPRPHEDIDLHHRHRAVKSEPSTSVSGSHMRRSDEVAESRIPKLDGGLNAMRRQGIGFI